MLKMDELVDFLFKLMESTKEKSMLDFMKRTFMYSYMCSPMMCAFVWRIVETENVGVIL